MKNSTVLLVAFMAIVSCSRDFAVNSEYTELQTIYASSENDSTTKSVIDNESLAVTWSAEDAINVFFGSSENSRFVTAEAGKIAQFKGSIGVVTGGGEGLDDETSLWGVYPYDSENVCDGNTVTLRLPFIQQSAENTFANGLFPVVARSKNFYMSFYNLCGAIRFSVSSPDIRAVTLSGNDGEILAGKVKVSMPLGGVPVVSKIVSGERELVMNAPDGECFKPGVLYYFVLFPTTFTKGITVTYHKKYTYASYVVSKTLTLERSNLSNLPDRDAGLTFVPETSSGDDDGTVYTDLSADGTANCYLISQSGNYKFKAVQGGNTDGTVGNVKSVEVLWESFGTDVAPNVGDLIASASYKDGYVRFKTPETFADGNAVIAAKNSKGTILWSWHIWCAKEGFKEQVYFNDAGTMMDRNLGATSATPGDVGCLGLLYQWGRKDPFLGSSSVSASEQAASTGAWTISSSSISQTAAEENPMTFYIGYSNYLPDGSWDSTKTAYDPCPTGWRVPKGGEEDGIWAKALGSKDSFSLSFVSGKYGHNFSGKFGDDSMIWYPESGWLDHDSGALRYVGIGSNCWSSTPYPDYRLSAWYLGFGNSTVIPANHYEYRSRGSSVRCLQE